MATPASNVSKFYRGKEASNTVNKKWEENPDNPEVAKAVGDWYHFYIPLDPVAGAGSGTLEGSSVKYSSNSVKNIQINPNDAPELKKLKNKHSFPYFPDSVIKAWQDSGLKRQE